MFVFVFNNIDVGQATNIGEATKIGEATNIGEVTKICKKILALINIGK